ncbi:uncharacterized protein LOC120080742 [Benincasa hispida]|uniref:uncharacterized protein LOC120080742 n=1 Tax=Benincasa hispida TaxID=102211 RepID=UPI0019003A11|nr:uncharacterized protein LOC120080742 [Benincasa hispida]
MSDSLEADTSNIVTTTEGATLESRRTTRKRKGIDKYTPPAQVKKKSVDSRVHVSFEKVKYPLPGVPTSLFRAIVGYNVAHDVPLNIFTEMMGWITNENPDNEVRKNSFKPLSKQFFKELIEPSSWVECDTINSLFHFMKKKKFIPDLTYACTSSPFFQLE